jgi:inorganic triphosphatase YgiF
MADDNQVEIELKLLASSETLDRLARHATIRQLSVGRPLSRNLHFIYWDTPSRVLRQAGLLLRTRRVGRRWIQTLKQESPNGRVAGLERRLKWEQPINNEAPDIERLADTPLADALSDKDVDALIPVFATDFRRTTRLLKTEAGDEIELALDRGEIIGTSGHEPICEAEFELKRGRPAALFAIARDLARELPLKVGRHSKSARGFLLGQGGTQTPVRGRAIALDPSMLAEDAFAAVARGCLDQLQGNEQPVAATSEYGPGDGEAVHQMRVALRRLRAAISLFGLAVRTEATEQIREQAKWLAGELGAARDLDVLLAGGIVEAPQALPEEAGLDALSEDLVAAREEAYERAVAAVSDQRFTDFVLAQGAWIEGRQYVADTTELERPVEDFAAEVLQRRHRKLVRAAAYLADLDDAGRHDLRIRVKKQRYAGEFFHALFPGKRAAQYTTGLAKLQDALGQLNDAAVARQVMAERVESAERVGSNRATDLRYAAGVVIGWQAREAARRWRKLAAKWQDSRRLKRFWPKPAAKEDVP